MDVMISFSDQKVAREPHYYKSWNSKSRSIPENSLKWITVVTQILHRLCGHNVHRLQILACKVKRILDYMMEVCTSWVLFGLLCFIYCFINVIYVNVCILLATYFLYLLADKSRWLNRAKLISNERILIRSTLQF